MKAETPAKGTMKTGEWPDAVSFHTECECSDPDHAVRTWVEVKDDAEVGHVEVRFYVETTTPFWDVSRWRAAWHILTRGHHRGQHTLILDSQAAINFAEAVKSSAQRLETNTNKKAK